MLTIDAEHAALLRGMAKNTNDRVAQLVYADWLDEHGSQGGIIIRHYRIQDWPVLCDAYGAAAVGGDFYRLPWLPGIVENPRAGPETWRGFVSDPRSRIKKILAAYAEGKTLELET